MKPLHGWTLSPDEAVKIQADLRERLNLNWDNRTVETIGGVDISLKEDMARAAIVIFRKYSSQSGRIGIGLLTWAIPG